MPYECLIVDGWWSWIWLYRLDKSLSIVSGNLIVIYAEHLWNRWLMDLINIANIHWHPLTQMLGIHNIHPNGLINHLAFLPHPSSHPLSHSLGYCHTMSDVLLPIPNSDAKPHQDAPSTCVRDQHGTGVVVPTSFFSFVSLLSLPSCLAARRIHQSVLSECPMSVW